MIGVDVGIATGSTARAACQAARAHGPMRVVLAVPVAPPGWQAKPGTDAGQRTSAGWMEAVISLPLADCSRLERTRATRCVTS